jgi:hypothetical protein
MRNQQPLVVLVTEPLESSALEQSIPIEGG